MNTTYPGFGERRELCDAHVLVEDLPTEARESCYHFIWPLPDISLPTL
jgi:hypothetical protein